MRALTEVVRGSKGSKGSKVLLGGYSRLNLTRVSFFRGKSSVTDSYVQLEPGKDDEIVIAMSSGVDSSVCASMYAKRYTNVRGIYMANWSQTARCTEAEWNDVERVCKHLNIPCERVNFEREYWTDVFQPMIQMYERGLTPNPDVGCNKYIKFGKMVEHLSRRFNSANKWWLVTGHYARVMKIKTSNEFHLLRGASKLKDQSYYLSTISNKTLPHILMPMGHLSKPQVREMAQQAGLPTAKKPDSQGLCFVSQDENNIRKFLGDYIPPKEGNIVTEDGKIWGKHQGLWHATIGQKLGISMPQGDPKYKGVWFVSEKRVESNELVIVRGGKNERLFKQGVCVEQWEWLGTGRIGVEEKCCSRLLSIQYRSLQEPLPIKSIRVGENVVQIELEQLARAMAPGQVIVLYESDRLLGSGVLSSTF